MYALDHCGLNCGIRNIKYTIGDGLDNLTRFVLNESLVPLIV